MQKHHNINKGMEYQHVMQHVSMKAEPSERLSEAKSMLLNCSARKMY